MPITPTPPSSPSGLPGGRVLVEPPGYAITSFVSTAALIGGIGLIWDGLFLAAAAMILAAIEWRRLRKANPWLTLDEMENGTPTFEGKIFMRTSIIGTVFIVLLAVVALVLAQTEDREIMVIGPALVGGVVSVALNYVIRRRIARGPGPTDQTPRMGDPPRPKADEDPRDED